MAIVDGYSYQPLIGDPDDHRPNTTWALVTDPATPDGDHVAGLSLLFERCAVGDKIPLHTHDIDEVIIIDDGEAEVRLGDEIRTVSAGAAVFVPASRPHGAMNVGKQILRLHGIFPSPRIGITYLERNPAPGTESDAPQPFAVFDARSAALES
jgi:quercetin dioxygenase-like cupin family protein